MTYKEIIQEIKSLEGKGTEPCPSYYAKLFIQILDFGEVPKNDQKRYLKYVVDFMDVGLTRSEK
jgi:hypothetical protein